jgi:hypothetical protein
MPCVTIRTGIVAADGQEEVLTEYVCDWPDCPNPAEHVMGVARDVGMVSVMCQVHAGIVHNRRSSGPVPKPSESEPPSSEV